MVKRCICALVLGLSPFALAQPLSLQQAVEKVLSHSHQLREGEARIQEASYKIDEAQAGGNPKLDLLAGYQHLTPGLQFNSYPLVVSENYDLSVNLQQALATFGRLEHGRKSAELFRDSRKLELRRQKQVLAGEAALSYLRVNLAGHAVSVAQEGLAAQQHHLQEVQLRVKAGASARFDQVTSNASLAQAQERLATAQSELELARARLSNLLGGSVGDLQEEVWPQRPLPELAAAGSPARGDLEALSLAVESAQARVALEESQSNPSLGLASRYSQRTSTAFQTPHQWSVGLQFSMPLFDGGLSQARANQARSQVDQLQEGLERAREMAVLEVREAHLGWKLAQQRLDLVQARLSQAQEALRIAQLRYQVGVSTNQEVLDAQSNLNQAELDRIKCQFDLYQAQIRWDQSLSDTAQNWPGARHD